MTLFERIKDLNYVVQRGWEGLPKDVGDDLDLFVDVRDLQLLEEIVENSNYPVKVDIRYPGDGYYPKYICDLLLWNTRVYNGISIPSKKAYFLALFYHSQVHGKEKKYQKELKRAFLDWIPAVEPDDKGVTYEP